MLECPKCGSTQVKLLPPSVITSHPGFRCLDCGILMRSRGVLFIYLIAFPLGVAFLVGGVVSLFFIDEIGVSIRAIGLGVVGAIVARYSILQIARPVPRRNNRV